MFAGHYRVYGPPVPRSRLRSSLNRVQMTRLSRVDRQGDPVRSSIKRRIYKVPGPLTLWYIDGHHKLIKYETLFLNV